MVTQAKNLVLYATYDGKYSTICHRALSGKILHILGRSCRSRNVDSYFETSSRELPKGARCREYITYIEYHDKDTVELVLIVQS